MNVYGQHFSALEIAGTLTGLAAVWLTVKENRWCFPLGIVSCILYAFVFFSPGIRFYADATLQLVYVVLLIYGWIYWKEKRSDLPVTRSGKAERLRSLALIAMGTACIGYLSRTFTDASLPYIDALTTSASLVAQWMVARKKIENWLLWIVANVIYIGMYIHKDLYVTAVYYFVLLLLAFAGWKEWRKRLEVRHNMEAMS